MPAREQSKIALKCWLINCVVQFECNCNERIETERWAWLVKNTLIRCTVIRVALFCCLRVTHKIWANLYNAGYYCDRVELKFALNHGHENQKRVSIQWILSDLFWLGIRQTEEEWKLKSAYVNPWMKGASLAPCDLVDECCHCLSTAGKVLMNSVSSQWMRHTIFALTSSFSLIGQRQTTIQSSIEPTMRNGNFLPIWMVKQILMRNLCCKTIIL